jgi:hypothetical protein
MAALKGYGLSSLWLIAVFMASFAFTGSLFDLQDKYIPDFVVLEEHAVAIFPFDLDDVGRPLVRVAINGHGPFIVLFDSGSSASLDLSPMVANKCNLEAPKRGESKGKCILIRELRLGDSLRLEKFKSQVANEDRYRGLIHQGTLGIGSFRDHKLIVRIDWKLREILVSRKALPSSSPNVILLPMFLKGGLPTIEAALGDRKLAVTCDTGSNSGLIFPDSSISFVTNNFPNEEIGEVTIRTPTRTLTRPLFKLQTRLWTGDNCQLAMNPSVTSSPHQATLGCEVLSIFGALELNFLDRTVTIFPPLLQYADEKQELSL